MQSPPPADGTRPGTPLGGSLLALRTGFREVTLRVQRMHLSIAGLTFRVLRRVPVVAIPARVVEHAHDAISGGVYAAVRRGGDAVLAAAAAAERELGRGHDDGGSSPLRSAVNGAFGDHLAGAGNPLAVRMELRAEDGALVCAVRGVRALSSDAGGRICIFLHGLGCDERSWRGPGAAEDGAHFGARLRDELGYTPLYLRFNTGLPIAANAREFAAMLEQLMTAHPDRELVLVGHSMGGLVSRSACRLASAAGMAWLGRVRMVICLGSPHRGATLEKAGTALAAVLGLHPVTVPLGEMADARSTGVRDLRHGLLAEDAAAWPVPPGMPCRLLGATLHRDTGHPLARILGDGLVTPDSATRPTLRGDVRAVRLGGMGHMRLLNDPRVYAQICAWLADG